VFRPAYSSKRLGYRASPLRISDSGVPVGLLSLYSPQDCPETNARPSGLRPSIHPHPPPLRFGTFPYRALGAGEGFWGWCLLEASAEIVSEALAQYFTQGLALLGGEQTRGEEIDILDAGVEHVQAADLKDAGELL